LSGNRMNPGLFFCCLSLSLLASTFLSVPVCAGQIYADPLVSYDSQGNEHTFRGFGPVLEFSDNIRALRPFYYKDKVTSEVDILYPLGRFTKERGLFFPIYRYTDRMDQEDVEHTEIFPVFYGKYKDISYWGVFPVYGTMYHRFGYTRARFFILPLYADTTLDEQRTYTFLWPIFSYSHDRLFRVFPLYGWKKSDDSTSQYFLWPFIQNSQGPDSHKMDAVLPLFRYDRGPTYRNVSILWPFFTYNRDDQARHMSVDFPWPLIRVASGAYEETKLFPLYWTKTEGNVYSGKTILWPLWSRASWHYEDTGTEQEIITILLMDWFTYKTPSGGEPSKRMILWPFLYTLQEGGHREWRFPCIIPLFFDDGFSRVWGPVLSMAEGVSDGPSSELSILWRTIYMEKKGDTQRFSLSFLFSTTQTPAYRQWGFLGNLLRFKQTIEKDNPATGE
jgi:hypothetical protein